MAKAFAALRKGVSAILLAAVPALLLLAPLFSVAGGPILGLIMALLLVLSFLALGVLLSAPAMVLLRVLARDNLVAHLFVGFVVGALIGSVLLGTIPDSDASPFQTAYNVQAGRLGAAIGGAYGIWSSAVWYALVRRRRKKRGGV